MVVAAIGGGGGFDLHRCRGVEHEVHRIPAYSFPKYGGSLAHEFNDSFLAVGLKPGTVRDPNAPVMNDRYMATNQVHGVLPKDLLMGEGGGQIAVGVGLGE